MEKSLILVESQTKANTLQSILGEKYIIKSIGESFCNSLKQINDIEVEHSFEPVFKAINEKTIELAEIESLISPKRSVYMATNPDIEGEFIAWRLCCILNIPDRKNIHRIMLSDLIKENLSSELKKHQSLNSRYANAYKARLVLHYLVNSHARPNFEIVTNRLNFIK